MAESDGRERRADAARNRARLLDAATRVFASTDKPGMPGSPSSPDDADGAAPAGPSMRAIAREAGVGIATLYRHFPTRETLVDAVYRGQVQRLTSGAHELLAELPPPAALRRWMDLFGNWIAAKNGMLDTLLTMIEAGELPHAETRDELLAAIDVLLEAGRASGEIRTDISAEDIAAGLIGVFTVAPAPDPDGRAARLLDLLMDGLRV